MKKITQEEIDRERLEFYAAVGRAMTSWQNVELRLFLIFETVMHPGPQKLSHAAFRAARHFEPKLRITDAVIKALADGTITKEWEPIHSRVRRNNLKRNDLAHFSSVLALSDEIINVDGKEYVRSKNTLRNLTQMFSIGGELEKRKEYTTDSIKVISQKFYDSSMELLKFNQLLRKHLNVPDDQ